MSRGSTTGTICSVTMRARVKPLLEPTEVWLVANNQVIMAVLVLLLGFVAAMKGLGRLVD